jgi:hypothetical protein
LDLEDLGDRPDLEDPLGLAHLLVLVVPPDLEYNMFVYIYYYYFDCDFGFVYDFYFCYDFYYEAFIIERNIINSPRGLISFTPFARLGTQSVTRTYGILYVRVAFCLPRFVQLRK